MKYIKILIILFSPFFVGWISLFIGSYEISPIIVLKVLLNETLHVFDVQDIPEKAIIWDIRLPRILTAFLVGASLSGAGVTLQAIFRNPLVDPYILGISAGAAFGCAITVGFLEVLPIQLMAFIFAILAVVLAYFIAKTYGEVDRLSLVLSGVIISSFFTALVSIVKFVVDPHKLQSIVYWLMGSFNLADWRTLKLILPGILLGLLPLFLMRWRLNVLSMGDEEAKMLGINVEKERMIFILFSTLSVATATSVCGIIGWIGLMVPHLIRMMVGPDHKVLLPLSFFGGGAFMIAADTLARTLTNFDIPVGIITAVGGAPFFVYLMKKRGRESWGK